MKLICLAGLVLSMFTQAAELPYSKVGAWSILAITNNDGTLNRCSAHLNGPKGFLRIAVTPDMKTWALSVPGTSAELRLTPGSQVSSELNYQSGNSVAGSNPTFKVDGGAAGRSSTRLDGETVKGLRSATKLDVTMYPKENCDRYSCKFREYVWQSPDFGKAMAALPACLKSN